MSIDKARKYLETFGRAQDILEFPVSSATVALAAVALGTEEKRIAKTLSFLTDDAPSLLIVMAGDARVDNKSFKQTFHMKARMIPGELAEEKTGHAPGGVCPFGNPDGTLVYLDESLKRFETVYPACGSSNSAIELTPGELFELSHALAWVDVCKDWRTKPEV